MSSKRTADKLLTAKQAAELLGLSASAVYQGKCGTAELTRVKLSPKVIRWSRNEVLAFLTRRLELAKAAQHKPSVQSSSNVIRLKFRDPLTATEIDDVVQGSKTLLSNAGALSQIVNSQATLTVGALNAFTSGGTMHFVAGELKGFKVRSNSGATLELECDVLRTGIDTSGNDYHGTWLDPTT